ncbi:PIP5K1 [Scenedesmus sp. PABB004]|nr:PIP5K1 [Scenedesmus sp. PABB004]
MQAELVWPVLGRLAECGALLAIGHALRSAGLFSATDAEAAQRLAGFLTLPAALLVACAALRFGRRHPRERAVLAGASVGADAPCVALPLLDAVAGPAGLLAGAAAVAANALAVCGGSYLLTASAGPAFPEAYAHADGGRYRGEWRGLNKEGLGVYSYPSGARYEGEWRANLKDGRGVYYYPKGGTYEGEWAGGVMAGTGLRTYATGRVAAGRWEGGALASPLELWQCATAAEGAAEAALAARRVVVGGGRPADAAALLVAQPALWAALAGLAVNAAALPLPPPVAALAGALAPANRPLMLLSAGMLLAPAAPQGRQVADVVALAAARSVAALGATSLALAAAPGAGHPAGALSLLAAAVVLLSPVPAAAGEFARSFRLSEPLARACRDASVVAAAPLLVGLAAAAGGLGLLPPPAAPTAGGALPAPGGAAADAGTLLAAGMLVLAAIIAVGAGVVTERLSPERGAVLRYAGPPVPAAAPAADEGSGAGRPCAGRRRPLAAAAAAVQQLARSRGGCAGAAAAARGRPAGLLC